MVRLSDTKGKSSTCQGLLHLKAYVINVLFTYVTYHKIIYRWINKTQRFDRGE
jgi:hypothetical protein